MLIFAHRGASAIEPENTLLAIKTAIELGAEAIEIDVFEIDNNLVVIHDRWLHRTTSGSGLIFDKSLQELRALDAGKGEQIPLLDEVLAILPSHCLLNIELKGVSNIALVFTCIERAQAQFNLQNSQLLLSSFNHQQLHAISQQYPDFTIGALTANLPLTYAVFAEELGAYSVHACIDFIDKNFVDDAHKRGLKVYIYTVDKFEDIARLLELGVDGFFANDPAQAKQYLQQLTC